MLAHVLALASYALPAAPQVHVVDDDGGPGVDFTSIADAVAAALPGDVILVAPGTYASFSVDEPLTVLGTAPGVRVEGDVTVRNVPADAAAAVAHLSAIAFRVEDCVGAVVLADLHPNPKRVVKAELIASGDVRLWRAEVQGSYWSAPMPAQYEGKPGLHAVASRLEAVECSFQGGAAVTPLDRPSGVELERGSHAHLVSVAVAGNHGYTPDVGTPGAGGDGLYLDALSTAVLGGVTAQGGHGGFSWYEWSTYGSCFDDAAPGAGVENWGKTLAQSVSAHGGGSYFGQHCIAYQGAGWYGDRPLEPRPELPRLSIEAAPVAGQPLRATVQGQSGAFVVVRLSEQLLVAGSSGTVVPELIGIAVETATGTLGASGTWTVDVPTPARWTIGQIAALQAEVHGSGPVQRSNSVPIVVR